MRRRVLISILVVIAVTVLTLGLPLGIVSWRLVADLKQQELSDRLQDISQSLTTQLAHSSSIDPQQLAVAVPADGRLVIALPKQPVITLGSALTGSTIRDELVLPGGGTLTLAVPADTVRSQQFEALGLVALAVLLSVVVAAVVAILLTRRLATPLIDLARRAARLGSGDFRTSSRRYGINELDRVAEVLDSSAADIAGMIHREQNLAADISHQLRTRLTGLQLRLEELSSHPDPAVVAEVNAALEQTDRLVTVVDDLLADSRSRRAAGAPELALAGVLTALADEWRPAFAGRRRQLQVDHEPDLVVRATPARLREALGALVDNGLRHGAGTVRVTAQLAGGAMVLIEVSDDGPGVADALAGHIFDRGVSTAASTGIGLGMARAFVEADGGRLELRKARPPVFGVFLAGGVAGEPLPVSPRSAATTR